jgi:hypothetical protein
VRSLRALDSSSRMHLNRSCGARSSHL